MTGESDEMKKEVLEICLKSLSEKNAEV